MAWLNLGALFCFVGILWIVLSCGHLPFHKEYIPVYTVYTVGSIALIQYIQSCIIYSENDRYRSTSRYLRTVCTIGTEYRYSTRVTPTYSIT